MDAVFLKLLNMSISGSWLILAVVILRFMLKKAPKVILCVLWALVAIRLICPISFESVFSLIPSAETVPQEIMYSHSPAISSGISAVNSAVNSVISGSFTPVTRASVSPLQVWTSIASYVWLAGLAAMLIYAFISFLRIKRKIAEAAPLRDNIWLCDHVDTPFILGVLRPRIYLPSAMEDSQTGYVIAHENAHLKRRDHWWKPLGFLLLAVYWFNPLYWLAYLLLCKDIEMACDEKVIRDWDAHNKKAYSEALLSCSVPRRMIAACPLAFGEVGVKARIKTVMNYKKPAFWIIVIAVVACVVVAVCFLTNPKSDDSESALFGLNYSVENVIFESGIYSFSYTAETAPYYSLTADKELLVLEDKASENWLKAGAFEAVELTKDNFDRYFWNNKTWWEGSASSLRRNNSKAWQLLVSDVPDTVFYYLLLQNNGDIYLTYGYYDAAEIDDFYSDDSSIRWVFKLTTAGESINAPQPGKSIDKELSLNDVIILSQKAEELTWSDFDCYSYIETGSGMYIRVYEIDERFSLWIGGVPDEKPMYIRLVSEENRDDYIDIRTEDVSEFISKHQAETYMFSFTIYMNPLSSYYPVDTTGYLYLRGEDSFAIVNEETGEVYAAVSHVDWDWVPMATEDWQALYIMGNAPDISGIHEPLMKKLSNKYYLFEMDGGLWLGEYGGKKNGMWSVYELTPYEEEKLPSAAELTSLTSFDAYVCSTYDPNASVT